MIQVAVYGKGGIGKSTISANLSYALAERGKSVIQIGCDPKHDSTRLLLGGRAQVTVLDYLRSTLLDDRKLSDIVMEGSKGVMCVEAGGPEPGVGCAGRGILTTFDAINKMGIGSLNCDIRLYDVLGDVVCGGFAVPLRKEYADVVYLVTSGEFMAVYAANNIMRGMLNFDPTRPRIGGIILNRRGMDNEDDLVERFSRATGVPIVARISRYRGFAIAEGKGKTIIEIDKSSDPAKAILSVADNIIEQAAGVGKLYLANPLNDDQLNGLAAGVEVACIKNLNAYHERNDCCRFDVDKEKKRVTTCAAKGAVYMTLRIRDAATLVHGPRSCGYMMMCMHDVDHISHWKEHASVCRMHSENLFCTDMDDSVSIFGGLKLLEMKLKEIIAEGYKTIFVVTTCVPGIIGDNCQDTIDRIVRENSSVIIKLIGTDGNIVGEIMDGQSMAVKSIIDIVDTGVTSDPHLVNFVGATFSKFRDSDNERSMFKILNDLDLKLNIRFVDDCDMDDVKSIKRARFNIRMSDTASSMDMAEKLENAGMRTFPLAMPSGYGETLSWVECMGEYLGSKEKAKEISERIKKDYRAVIERCSPYLTGKKAIVVNTGTKDLNWVLESLSDVGVEVIKVGVCVRPDKRFMESSRKYSDRYDMEFDYLPSAIEEDIERLHPDIVISDGRTIMDYKCCNELTPIVDISSISSIKLVEHLSYIIRTSPVEGWRLEGELL